MGFSNQCFFKATNLLCCWVSVKFLSHDSFFLKKWLPDPNLFRDLRPTRKGNFLLIRRKFHKPIIPFECTLGIEDYLNFLRRIRSQIVHIQAAHLSLKVMIKFMPLCSFRSSYQNNFQFSRISAPQSSEIIGPYRVQRQR